MCIRDSSNIEQSKFVILDHYPGKWFEPIPLTEEWLLTLGFVKNKERGYFGLDRLIVAFHDGVDQFYLCDIDIFVKIETVHHLQNLYFAIRNKELTLNP